MLIKVPLFPILAYKELFTKLRTEYYYNKNRIILIIQISLNVLS